MTEVRNKIQQLVPEFTPISERFWGIAEPVTADASVIAWNAIFKVAKVVWLWPCRILHRVMIVMVFDGRQKCNIM